MSREYPLAFMPFSRLIREAQRMCSFYRFLNKIFSSAKLMNYLFFSDLLCPMLKNVFGYNLKCESPKVISYLYFRSKINA